MGSRKYKQGKRITSLQEFEKSDCSMFEVRFGGCDSKLLHRGFLESLQMRTLKTWLYSGRIFETIKVKQEENKNG